MIGFSKEYPAPVVKSRGMFQIRYNIKKIPAPDGDGDQYQFEYQYAKEATETEILKTLSESSVTSPDEVLTSLLDKDGKLKVHEIDPVTLKQAEVKEPVEEFVK